MNNKNQLYYEKFSAKDTKLTLFVQNTTISLSVKILSDISLLHFILVVPLILDTAKGENNFCYFA